MAPLPPQASASKDTQLFDPRGGDPILKKLSGIQAHSKPLTQGVTVYPLLTMSDLQAEELLVRLGGFATLHALQHHA
jgi:hypothetical protein